MTQVNKFENKTIDEIWRMVQYTDSEAEQLFRVMEGMIDMLQDRILELEESLY